VGTVDVSTLRCVHALVARAHPSDFSTGPSPPPAPIDALIVKFIVLLAKSTRVPETRNYAQLVRKFFRSRRSDGNVKIISRASRDEMCSKKKL